MKPWSMPSSGNSYKVRLLLALFGAIARSSMSRTVRPRSPPPGPGGRLPLARRRCWSWMTGSCCRNRMRSCAGWAKGRASGADAFLRAQMLELDVLEQNQHEGTVAVRGALLYYPPRRHLATPSVWPNCCRGANLQIMEDRLAA